MCTRAFAFSLTTVIQCVHNVDDDAADADIVVDVSVAGCSTNNRRRERVAGGRQVITLVAVVQSFSAATVATKVPSSPVQSDADVGMATGTRRHPTSEAGLLPSYAASRSFHRVFLPV